MPLQLKVNMLQFTNTRYSKIADAQVSAFNSEPKEHLAGLGRD